MTRDAAAPASRAGRPKGGAGIAKKLAATQWRQMPAERSRAAFQASGKVAATFFCAEPKNLLQSMTAAISCASPKFARACGRVSVGGHPDKRPDSRPERDRKDPTNSIGSRSPEAPKPLDRQPEAKPAHPALNGGRGLKQRRSGLFWSRWPLNKVSTEEACSLLPRRGTGSPAPIQGIRFE